MEENTPPESGADEEEAPLRIITAYDISDADTFRRMKRKKWGKLILGVRGEWSQSPYHDGDVSFSLRSTEDGRYWALYTEAFVRKIEAVIEAPRETCAEEVAAEAMQAVKDASGPYVDLIEDYRDLDGELFSDYLHDAKVRSRQRKQARTAAPGSLRGDAPLPPGSERRDP